MCPNSTLLPGHQSYMVTLTWVTITWASVVGPSVVVG